MWTVLSDPQHAMTFAVFGPRYEAMHRLVQQLAHRPYANIVSAFSSLFSFCLTTAHSYDERYGHDEVGVRYSPDKELFGVSYDECVSRTRNPMHRTMAGRIAQPSEVVDIVDQYVIRLLLVRQERLEHRNGAQS